MPVINAVHLYNPAQTPQFVGNLDRRLFSNIDEYLDAFDFSQRRNYRSLTLKDVQQKYTRYREKFLSQLPQTHYSFGRAFLEKGSYDEAVDALQRAIAFSEKDYSEFKVL
ncbi:MAG TPA: hypothetical protein VEL31_09945 [Ktedonobacteraceae bacterium]|nr:hypothetical protein [Ktedonobacteraceae bacterium]